MELLSSALRNQRVSFMDHLDLIFKWISLRLCEKENVKAMGQVGCSVVAHFIHSELKVLVCRAVMYGICSFFFGAIKQHISGFEMVERNCELPYFSLVARREGAQDLRAPPPLISDSFGSRDICPSTFIQDDPKSHHLSIRLSPPSVVGHLPCSCLGK